MYSACQLMPRKNDVGDRRPSAARAIVETDRACSEIHNLTQSARDHEILEEVDHYGLIGEVAMKEDRGYHAPEIAVVMPA